MRYLANAEGSRAPVFITAAWILTLLLFLGVYNVLTAATLSWSPEGRGDTSSFGQLKSSSSGAYRYQKKEDKMSETRKKIEEAVKTMALPKAIREELCLRT